MAKNETAMSGGVPLHPQAAKPPSVRVVAAGGIVAELRQAIAQAEEAGVSRATIAKAAGMPRTMIYRIADGRTLPRIDTAERLASAIGFNLRLVAK